MSEVKPFVKLCFLIFFIVIFLFLTHHFLFPFIYKIKEPCFEMPIAVIDNSPNPYAHGSGLPIRHDAYGDGEFGAKRNGGRTHKGLDLATEIKSPVYASKSGWGRVRYIPRGYGNLVIIDHPGRWQTRYGHLDEIYIKKFQWVRQGDIIGSVGKTGNAQRSDITAHIHFEISYKGEPLDPAVFLAR